MAPETRLRGRWSIENAGAAAIVALGLVFGTLGTEYVVSDPEPLAWWSAEFAVASVLPAGLMYAGYWLARTDFEAAELWRVTAWSFAGVVALTAAGGWMLLHQTSEGGRVAEPAFLLVTLATIGALAGVAGGVATAGALPSLSGAGRTVPGYADQREEKRNCGAADPTAADPDDGSRPGEWIGLPSVPVDEREVESPDLETLVAGEQRRWAIAYLTAAPGRVMTVHQIVDAVVERRLKTTGERPDREQVLRRLHCIDLPKLAAAGLIERDEYGVIRYVGDPETTRQLLGLVNAIEANGRDD